MIKEKNSINWETDFLIGLEKKCSFWSMEGRSEGLKSIRRGRRKGLRLKSSCGLWLSTLYVEREKDCGFLLSRERESLCLFMAVIRLIKVTFKIIGQINYFPGLVDSNLFYWETLFGVLFLVLGYRAQIMNLMVT